MWRAYFRNSVVARRDHAFNQVLMTKYFKRGLREFYSVSPEKVMKLINKACKNEVTIYHGNEMVLDWIREEALEGQEITREEFAEQFKVASRLIVMEP